MVDWKDIARKKSAEIERMRTDDKRHKQHLEEAQPRLEEFVNKVFETITAEIDQYNAETQPEARISIQRTPRTLLCTKSDSPKGSLEITYVEPPAQGHAAELH